MIVKCVGQHTLPERGNFSLTLGYHQGEVSNVACCLRGGGVDHCGQGSKRLFQFGNIENVIQFEMIGCYLGSGNDLQELTRDSAPGNDCGDVFAFVDRALGLRCGLTQNIYIWGVPIRHTISSFVGYRSLRPSARLHYGGEIPPRSAIIF